MRDASKLLRTPRDDWDLREKKVSIDFGDEVQVIGMNPLHPMNQIASLIMKKHPGAAGRAHGFRFTQIQDFLHDHEAELVRDGLMIVEGQNSGLADVLLYALAVLPYSESGVENGEPFLRYSYAEVVAAAEKFEGESGDADPGDTP